MVSLRVGWEVRAKSGVVGRFWPIVILGALLLSGCGRGRALPDDPALGLGSFPTPSPTPPRPPALGSSVALPADATATAPAAATPLVIPRFVLPTIAAPTFVPTATPEATATLVPVAPPEPPTSDVQVRNPRPVVTPFAIPPEPEQPRPRETARPRAVASPTPRPTDTPAPTPTPTETRVPTATREPPKTPTPTHPFAVERTYGAPNCTATEIRGRFLDKAGRGVSGNVVRVTALHKDAAPVLGLPSRADGSYEVTLARGPDAGRWQVQALAPGGQPLSPPIVVETSADDCRSSTSRQTIYVEFRQVK
jgi:hypothetical protein